MDWERPRLMDRVMNRLGYRRPPPTTVVGVTSERLDDPLLGLGRIGGEHELSSVRLDIYRDMDEIDGLMPEGSRALDILADNAVNSPEGTQRSFSLRFDEGRKVSQSVQSVILDVVDRTRLQEKAYEIARSALKYGDNFQQIVVGKGMYIERLMYMEPASMRRNEDATGLLMTGKEKGRWAFEQYVPRTNQFIAGFYPWQIEHVRWARSGKSKYGRALLHTARYPFKKLQSMEEALVVNWLTRAFARILFKLDVTGKTPQEAQAYLEAFMQKLNRRSGTDMERMTVAKDIAIGLSYHDMGGKREPSRDDVQVLDTSNTGFWNITAVEYWRDKFITATGVPKAHLGLEQDINAKCLALDTRIPLLRGETVTLADIIAEYETKGDAPWVLSWDQSTGRIVPGKISWAGVTRKQAKVVEVELDDGTCIRATPDHRFYDIKGQEIEAQNLKRGQQLLPLRMYVSGHKNYSGYVKVKDPHGKVVPLHRRVAETLWPAQMVPGINIHHVNRNKRDNSPENLSILSFHEHLAVHTTDRFETFARFRTTAGAWNKGITKQDDDERAKSLRATTYIEKVCENPACDVRFTVPLAQKKRRFCSKQCAGIVSANERCADVRLVVTCEHCGAEFITTFYKLNNGRGQFCSATCRVAGLRERKRQEKVCAYCGETFSVYTRRGYGRQFCGKSCSNTFQNKARAGLVPVPNHRVRQVRILDEVQDTGDITVEGWHNFFVADASGGGVLVHNSTLQWQDERFARTIRRVQMMMSETIQHVIDLELRLHGINPQKIDYVIEWPTPSMLDTQTHSETVLRYAQAAEKLIASGVVDADYVAAHWLKMTPAQIGRVQTPGGQNGGMGRD